MRSAQRLKVPRLSPVAVAQQPGGSFLVAGGYNNPEAYSSTIEEVTCAE